MSNSLISKFCTIYPTKIIGAAFMWHVMTIQKEENLKYISKAEEAYEHTLTG